MRFDLTDQQWERILDVFPKKTETRGRKTLNLRQTVNGIFYLLRTGIPWRDLPERYGSWRSVYTTFRRLSYAGIWDKIHQALSKDADLEQCFLDSTTCVVHQHGLGAKGGKILKALGEA